MLGTIGYVALLTRFVFSTGSHMYSLWTMPELVKHPGLVAAMHEGKPLASIYSTHGDLINLVLGVGLLGLVYAMLRIGRPMRTLAVFLALAAVSEVFSFPLALPFFGIVAIWFGLRLTIRDDVAATMR